MLAGCSAHRDYTRHPRESELQALLDCNGGRPSEVRVRGTFGRVWTSGSTSIIEVLFDKSALKTIGVLGAVVVEFDGDRVVAQRLYVDRVSVLGQLDPSSIPNDLEIRVPFSIPPEGRGRVVSQGSAMEMRNLGVANAIWAALDRHQAAEAMADAAGDYRYEDYAAPKALDRAETQRMVAGFLQMIPDFSISAKPVQFAAGDDVITEMTEKGTFDGRAVTLHGLDIKRFRDGKVVKEWQYSDYAEVLEQLFGTQFADCAFRLQD